MSVVLRGLDQAVAVLHEDRLGASVARISHCVISQAWKQETYARTKDNYAITALTL